MFSFSHFLLYVPYPGLLPQSPFSLSVQGRQGHKQITTKSLWDFYVLHRHSFHLPFHLSVSLLSLFFTIMKSFSFSVPLQASSLSCVSSGLLSSPVTCAWVTPIANSKNAVVVYIFTPARGSPQWHWPAGCWQLLLTLWPPWSSSPFVVTHLSFCLGHFLFWAAASLVAWPLLCPCICQLSTSSISLEGRRESGLMAENNTA